MQLEQMFAGPLQDTVVQRWRDPQTGTLCYLYVPFTVQHSDKTPTGAVQYGPNNIGSISCTEPAGAAPKVASPQPAPSPPATARKPAPASPAQQHPALRGPTTAEPSAQQ